MNETDALAEAIEWRCGLKVLNSYREHNPVHSKTREEIEALFRRVDQQGVFCPVVVNAQRLPLEINWAVEEDREGVLETGSEDCAFGEREWHPGQLVLAGEEDEMEFDNDKDTMEGASRKWYSGGTED